MNRIEGQLDRVAGPTHHFGGLGVGNVASQTHRGQVSNPAAAALQGLDKMRLVASLGVPQFVLPPQRRPQLALLRELGFRGSDADVLARVRDESPDLLSAAMSCSAMWTANAATVTPSGDAAEHGPTQISVANLQASLHRAIEPEETLADLRETLPKSFQFYGPLPGGAAMRDEGAANQMRLSSNSRGAVHVFVYGDGQPSPERYWPRQSMAASQAVARRHGLDGASTFYLQQHPRAIDAGAFHNDVVAMSDGELLIHHEFAFCHTIETMGSLEQRFSRRTGCALRRIMVDEAELPVEDAVSTYLFNSQILSLQDGDRTTRAIVCPVQVAGHPGARGLITRWQAAGIFSQVHFVDLGQSMNGGGGPACLRLRVPMSDVELNSLPAHRRWSERLDGELREAIQSTYPKAVTMDDLARIDFVEQAAQARNCVAAILEPR